MGMNTLETPILDLGGDRVTLRDIAQNVLVTGVTGGGKTSGPGRHLFTGLLMAECGGIVLCAKPGEADEVLAMCRKAGRLASTIVWNGRNGGFNFLDYALAKLGPDGINGVIEQFLRIVEMTRNASALQASNGEAFWLDELRRMLRHALPVIHAATGTLRMADILAFVRSAPTEAGQMRDPAWQRQNGFFVRCFADAAGRMDDATGERMVAFWDEFSRMDGKLRGSILAGFTMLDRFNHGWLRDAFCGGTSLPPALCLMGVVIILDMPRATMGEDGMVAQMLYKDALQTDILGRNALAPMHRERFCFIYGDEAQEFLTSRDAEFLAMSRSSRCGTIYLTQSLPGVYAKIGGQNAHDRAHHLISNMGVRIFCANSCTTTNDWASQVIGKTVQRRASFNASEGSNSSYGSNMGMGTNEGSNHGWGTNNSYSSGPNGNSTSSGSSWNEGRSEGSNESRGYNHGSGTNRGTSHGWSENVDFLVQPGFFARGLKTGGPANGNRVSAVWFQAGRTFAASGGNALVVEFQQ